MSKEFLTVYVLTFHYVVNLLTPRVFLLTLFSTFLLQVVITGCCFVAVLLPCLSQAYSWAVELSIYNFSFFTFRFMYFML